MLLHTSAVMCGCMHGSCLQGKPWNRDSIGPGFRNAARYRKASDEPHHHDVAPAFERWLEESGDSIGYRSGGLS